MANLQGDEKSARCSGSGKIVARTETGQKTRSSGENRVAKYLVIKIIQKLY